MKVSLVFENTGDTIDFDVVNQEIVEYYVENLNNLNKNSFSSTDSSYIANSINHLQQSISTVNEFMHDLIDIRFDSLTESDCLDQNVLNRLHSQWVNMASVQYNIKEMRNSTNPKSVEFADKLFHQSTDDEMIITMASVLPKLGLSEEYLKINTCLHILENSVLNFRNFVTSDWIEIPNIFPKNTITNDRYNLLLPFGHLGRTLYNKFRFFDLELEHQDENTFNQLLGIVSIRLQKKETVPFSAEYLEWCKKHNKVPSGANLSIGILPNIDTKLHEYRTILHRNIYQKNKFLIELKQ
jgi:hypothetical protein